MGTVHGATAGASFSPGEGFRDPGGEYPRPDRLGNDVPMLARESAEQHPSLLNKRSAKEAFDKDSDEKVVGVQVAKAYKMDSITTQEIAENHLVSNNWYEPNPRYGGDVANTFPETVSASTYPYNKVKETESGHVFEVDDTPGSERIHNYHTSGTFEEIQANGDKIIKVVGNNYEIKIKNDNVFIGGSCNITIEGDARTLVKGNHFLEVEENLYETVHGNKYVKIKGTEHREILTDSTTQINGNNAISITKNDTLKVGSNSSISIGNNHKISVGGKSLEYVTKYKNSIIKDNLVMISSNGVHVGAGGIMSVGATEQITINTQSNIKVNATGTLLMHSDGEMNINSDRDINVDSGTPTYHINLNS